MRPISPSAALLPPQLAAPDPARKGAKAAREFEASLIASLLEICRKDLCRATGR